jgi:integron integrase
MHADNKTAAIERTVAQLRKVMAFKHMAITTEKSYAHWARRYIWWLFEHPAGTSEEKVRGYLTELADQQNVSASTQAQALNAIVYLYREVWDKPLGDIGAFSRARRPRKLPTVLSADEVQRLRGHLSGVHWLIASLLYGAGLRLKECLSLRTQDIDFDRHQIMIRNGKGAKDRTVRLPVPLVEPLRQQIEIARRIHRRDLSAGFGEVYLPHALERKLGQSVKDFKWQYLFQASRVGACPRTGVMRRHHLHSTAVSKGLRAAAKSSGILKRVSAHTLRHSYATHLVERGVGIEAIQELMGHADVRTTMIYLHVAQDRVTKIHSPLENSGNVVALNAVA